MRTEEELRAELGGVRNAHWLTRSRASRHWMLPPHTADERGRLALAQAEVEDDLPEWILHLSEAEVQGIRRGLQWVLGEDWDDQTLDT